MERWVTPGRFWALLGVLILISFPDVLLGIKSFIHRDYGLFGYPLAFHHRESFWNGEMPLWNPLNNFGLPFLAQWNTLTLYPPSLLYVLLPLPWSLNLFLLLHLFWAGLGMHRLALKWTDQPSAAAVAGVAYAFSGLLANALIWPNNMAALGWLPWVVLLAEAAFRHGGRHLALGAMAGGMQMLTGAPEVILFTWVIVLGVGGVQAWEHRDSIRIHLFRFAGLVILVALLAAAQLLPFLDLLQQSHRTSGFSDASWSMPAWGLLNYVVPLFRMNPSISGGYLQPDQFWTSSYYAGIGVLGLALVAVIRCRSRRVWMLAALAVVGWVLALGSRGVVYDLLRGGILPMGFMRFPIKFVVLSTFALPLLAAFALRVQPGEPPAVQTGKMKGVIGVLLLLMVGAVVMAVWRPIHAEGLSITLQSAGTRAFFLLATVGILWWMTRSNTIMATRLALLGLPLLVWCDLETHSPGQNPTIPPGVLSPGLLTEDQMNPLPRLGESRALLTLSALEGIRFSNVSSLTDGHLLTRVTLFDNCNLLDGVPKADGFYSLYLAAERDVHFRLFATDSQPREGLADFLGVSHASSPTNFFEWLPREKHMPMLNVGQRPVFLDRTNTLKHLISEAFHPREEVLLPLEARAVTTAMASRQSLIVTQRVTSHLIEAEIQSDQPTWLVLAQSFHPNWHATIDSQSVRVWPANHAFQALEIPAGRHHVKLVYRDRAFTVGSILSMLGWIGCVGGWWRLQPRHRTLRSP